MARRIRSAPHALLAAALVFAALLVPLQTVRAQTPGACTTPTNPVACENTQTGNPSTEWDVVGSGDPSIQGFATDISVNKGQTVAFKINTPSPDYRLDIYRLGYYGGMGARKITTIEPSATLPQSQPGCSPEVATGLIDCGNWVESASWPVPASAISGIYIARLVREDAGNVGKASHVPFVVRDDAGGSALLFQTSDTTWHAYNSYGGNSLYLGNPAGRAYKVSYNRPFNNRQFPGGPQESYLFNSEYPMVRWLERNGYDVSYTTGVDSDRRGAELLEHDVFLSVGHDEYWSAAQRTNVENARGAGVNLAFFSGNEVFWKTRWENNYRTLVSYKESHANAKIDPNAAWTGTWRDARFSPPSDGGRPENALTGTLFMVNGIRNDTITVPAADGKMRFWRNTSVASLGAGQSATLTQGTLGYEWDEDVDNGSRPPGAFRLSTTNVEVNGQYLLDEDNNWGSATARHSLVLYRHASGALVFGAGTVQWPWGLEAIHDRGPSVPDVNMQQATVNLLADMNVQPRTLQSGLVTATASTDTTRPTSTISSPAAGANVTQSAPLTITGTASDAGGGQVGGVEVSVDGGTTWHPATGRATWSYTWTPVDTGPASIRVRAVDDSGNLETPGQTRNVTVVPQTCPCSIWPTTATPALAAASEVNAVELGVKFRADQAGFVNGIRFYKGAGNTGTHVGNLWSSAGANLATATFTGESATGWQQVNFASPVAIQANTTYVASYHAPNGRFAVDLNYFTAEAFDNVPLHALRDGQDGGNGLFRFGPSGFPTQTYQASNYWVDVVYTTTPPAPDTTPPTISAVQATGASHTGATITWTTNEPATTQIEYGTTTAYGSQTTLESALVTAHSQPIGGLSPSTLYHYRVKSRDAAGNQATSSDFMFTTTSAPSCPCSIWTPSATPAVAAQDDSNSIELGVKFRSDVAGYISGIRFYKGAGNSGTHTGSLWNATGTRLAQATFTGETATGWQQVSFASPVAISANTTYVASYFAPNGHYSRNESGLAAAGVDNAPLHALRSGVDGPNGLYLYSGASAFPTNSFNATNYWVDVVFTTTPPAPDTTPPTISAVQSTNVASNGATITWTTNEPADSQVEYGLTTGYGSSTTLDPLLTGGHSVPVSGLNPSTLYHYRVKSRDAAGNLATSADFTFTTTAAASCPCSIWSGTATPEVASDGETAAVELGVKFRSDVAGYISGIRFYKGPSNTGTHVGSLWNSTGTRLAQATFTGETATGWQQVSFASPVAITANTTYVASYFAPNGGFAVTRSAFGTSGVDNVPLHALRDGVAGGNGVFRFGPTSGFPSGSYQASNYFVDVVFSTTPPAPDTTPPAISAVQATSITGSGATITWTTNEAADSQVEYGLSTSYGSQTTLDAAQVSAHSVPLVGLNAGATYHYRVKSRDAAGNLSTSGDFTFTTGAAPSCPCSIWSPSAVPAVASQSDTNAVELGVKFRSDSSGLVTGVRFYKGAANTGTHIGSLWSSTGTRLAHATFSGETGTGWQTVTFSTPVAITAGVTYVASYHAPNGGYARNEYGFQDAGVDTAPLHALRSGVDGPNGLYAYGPAGTFPTNSYHATNYWVDVVFATTP